MKTLYNKKWYTPMDIARRGLIQNSRGDKGTISGHYNFILELIKSDELLARNYSHGKKRANWLVAETEIQRYHKTYA